MWPFSSRSSQDGTIAPTPRDLPDSGEFEQNDTEVKVWLPQLLLDRVNWLSKTRDASRPDVIRALLFEHLYGRVAYEALVRYAADKRAEAVLTLARQTQLATWSTTVKGTPSSDDIRMSKTRSTEVDLKWLGKSIDDLEVKLPSRMKVDLEEVAARYHLTASSYVRKMLVLQLLGEPVHTAWQKAVGVISKDVLQIEKTED